jgi:ankyrin repeat protein
MKQKHIDRAQLAGYAGSGQSARASVGKAVAVEQTQTVTGQEMQRPGVLKAYFEDIVGEPSQVVKNTQLVRAAAAGDITWVQDLVKHGADVHTGDDRPLRFAAANGHAKIVEILLDAGASIHAVDDAALREAAKSGYNDVVSILLGRGANVHAREDEALKLASERRIQTPGPFRARQKTPSDGHDKSIKLLHKRGA